MKKYLSEYPELLSEWHPTKNKDLKPPEKYTHGSNVKVWWKCPKGDDHEWQATINKRVIGRGCRFCSGHEASKTNNLLVLNPKLASEWHPTKNGDKRPEHYTLGSRERIWWKCPKGDDHVWDAYIFNRTRKDGGTGCPVCAGQQVSKTNNLLVLNPKLASEWHPTKNGDKRPEEFLQYSSEKVWWKCPKGDDHEWRAIIANRSRRGDSCIFCSSSGTSKPEIRILCELRYLFDLDNVSWRSRIHGEEIDIFLQEYNIGIEYDGFHWHKKTKKSDLKKNFFFQNKGIQIIRVREYPLKVLSKNDVIHKKTLNKNDLNTLVYRIEEVLKPFSKIDFNDYINKSNFLNEKVYKRFISFLPSLPTEYSILGTHPEIAKQWHYKKNGDLKPEHYTHGSDEIVWWKCPKGDDHEWELSISNRIRPTRCPFCIGKRATKINNLLINNPQLASEWHPTKNGNKKPEDFTPFSSKKVWWQCSKNKNHEFQADIRNRNRKVGGGCGLCNSKRKIIISKTKLNKMKKMRQDGISYKKISEKVKLNYMMVYRALNKVNKNQSKI